MIHSIIVILFCLVSAFFCPDRACCSEMKLIPSIHLRQEYTDNLFMTQNDIMDDFITTASPGLTVKQQSERLKLNLNSRLDRAWYHQNNELNGFDKVASGGLSYAVTERLDLSADASYLRDSRPDRDLDDTGLILDSTKRDRYNGGVSGNYLISEKTSATLSSSFHLDDYQTEGNENNDYKSNTVNMGIYHQPAWLNQLTTIFCNAQYSQYAYETSTVDYYSISTGAESDVSETFNIRFDLGARYTVSEFQTSKWVLSNPPYGYEIVSVEETNRSKGGIGQISLNYHGEFIHCAMRVSHDIQPASGRDGSSERTSMALTVGKRFTEELNCSLDGSYFVNNADEDEFSSVAIDEETFQLSFKSRYNFSPFVYLEAGHSFTRIMDETADDKVDRNLTFINYVHGFEMN
ncbi:MAG: hypothetical protein C0403_15445 [Desulfobacterium sp.]|nr:hypothetical protein [Desulfobacterium sp.]